MFDVQETHSSNFDVFRGYRNGTLPQNELIIKCFNSLQRGTVEFILQKIRVKHR